MSGRASEIEEEKSPTISGRTETKDRQVIRVADYSPQGRKSLPEGSGGQEMKQVACRFCASSAFCEYARFAGTTERYRDQLFTYARCKTCRSVIGLIDDTVDYNGYPISSHLPRLELRRVLSFLAECRIERGSRILDYGCGNGRLITRLRQEGFDAEGYDPHHAEFESVKGAFQLVCLIHVFEHLADIGHFLTYLNRLTEVESQVMVVCPSSTRLPKLDPADPFQRYLIHAPFHLFIPSDKTVASLFSRGGYELERHLPYDVVRSGFLLNNNVDALLQDSLGEIKEALLGATPKDRIVAFVRSPYLNFMHLFLRRADPLVSTFVFRRVC